jgi:hypothetical protein
MRTYPQITKAKRTGGMAQVVESLSSKCKTLSSNIRTTKKKKKKRKRKDCIIASVPWLLVLGGSLRKKERNFVLTGCYQKAGQFCD